MAVDKRYLDLVGLESLIDKKAIVVHPSYNKETGAAQPLTPLTTKSFVKVTIDENGHIVDYETANLSSAMRFVGISTSDPKGSTGATVSGVTSYEAGHVVLYKRTGETGYEEYINLNGSNTPQSWELLGDADSYSIKGHTHTVVIPENTFLASASAVKTHISLNKSTSTLGVTHLATDSITGVSGHTTASKATAGTAVNVATVDEAVTYGNANVGSSSTVATITNSNGSLGNANYDTNETKIWGLATDNSGNLETTTASRMTAGTAKSVASAGTAVVFGKANVGTAVEVATRASSQTTVGNANVGSDVSIWGLKSTNGVLNTVTASKATAATAITYGNADVGSSATVATIKDGQGSVKVGNANVGAAVTVGSGTFKKSGTSTAANAYFAEYVESATAGEGKLVLTALTADTQSVTPAASASNTVSTLLGTTTVTSAKSSSKSLTPYTFADVSVPVAESSSTTFKQAASSGTKIYAVGGVTNITPAVAAPNSQTIVPAVANGTITPYTAESVTVPVAAEAITGFHQATASSTKVSNYFGTTSVTSAVLSETELTPAKANGTITPYTFSDITVPVAATAKTVATGALDASGTGGLVYTGNAAVTVLTNSTAITSGNSGDVEVATGISSTGNATTTITSGASSDSGI